MSVPESQLREQYRNASDEELLFLAQQASSAAYTATAWALLQEEMTRRGLPPTPVQGLENAEELRAEKASAVLPLSRWGEIPDTGIRDAVPPTADQRQQTYRLGRLFAVLQVSWLFMHVNLFAQDISYLAVYDVAWSALTGVAAAGRAAWRWHTLVTALAISIGVRGFLLVDLAVAGELGVMAAAGILGGMIVNGLWFGYFYRRRAMFDATRRWKWLERHVPVVVGPGRYESTPLPLTPVSQPPSA